AVVASIKPVHALAAGVMAGLGEPGLIIAGAESPHSFALRPSQAALLAEADLVLWIGPPMERFLERPLASLAAEAEALALMDAPGVTLLPAGAEHEHEDAQAHGDHGHEHEDAHGDHGHEQGWDPHIWLDPQNAIAMSWAIAEALAGQDPENAGAYRANAARQA